MQDELGNLYDMRLIKIRREEELSESSASLSASLLRLIDDAQVAKLSVSIQTVMHVMLSDIEKPAIIVGI